MTWSGAREGSAASAGLVLLASMEETIPREAPEQLVQSASCSYLKKASIQGLMLELNWKSDRDFWTLKCADRNLTFLRNGRSMSLVNFS